MSVSFGAVWALGRKLRATRRAKRKAGRPRPAEAYLFGAARGQSPEGVW